MLYQVGPVTISTFPFSIDAAERNTAADYAPKELIGRLRDREFVGEGDHGFVLKGKILPGRMMPGGLLMLDVLHGARLGGVPVFVMRGDFHALGWFVIESVKESHSMLDWTGVGQIIDHEITFTKVKGFGSNDAGYTLISSIISLFG